MEDTRRIQWFLFAEVLLYIAFLTADIQEAFLVSVTLKYCAILLCLTMAWMRTAHGGERTVFFALLLTAAADLFLLVLERWFPLGIGLFVCVQALYARRISLDTAKTAGVRGLLTAAAWLVLWRMEWITPTNLLAGLYFPQLLCNTVLAWRLPAKWGRRFAWGLTLFVCCDVCVGLWNLPDVPQRMAWLAGYGMWMFYLPSQVLIVLSARPGRDSGTETSVHRP